MRVPPAVVVLFYGWSPFQPRTILRPDKQADKTRNLKKTEWRKKARLKEMGLAGR
jgi:hypothetical protein